MKTGLVAEFDGPDGLLRAIEELRRLGYRDLDAFTPYPLKSVEDALGCRRSPITWLVLPFWVAAGAAAYFVQWYCNAYDYPLDVGGRPPHSIPAFVPITFEMSVLATAISSLLLLFAFAGLPELYHPVFNVDGFERATRDRFFLGIDASDPAFDGGSLRQALGALGATRVSFAGEPER